MTDRRHHHATVEPMTALELVQPERASRKKLELALRNCLAMANRMRSRARHPADEIEGIDPWADIVRFCAEAGVVPNILREADDAG